MNRALMRPHGLRLLVGLAALPVLCEGHRVVSAAHAARDSTGKVVYVNKSAAGAPHDGTSWERAFLTVKEGIKAATAGDEVWVAKATYVECIDLKDGILLYGGFNGTETARDQRDWKKNITILDGNRKGCVVDVALLLKETRVDGFTVRNGKADSGGGISHYASPLDLLTIANNIISGNSAVEGGGIFLGAEASVIDNIISGNTAEEAGGGILCALSWVTINGNEIRDNDARDAGGIYGDEMDGEISNNIFSGNSDFAIRCNTASNARILNNVLSLNERGGIVCYLSNPKIYNNTIFGNGLYEDSTGEGILLRSSSPSIANNIVAFNKIGIDATDSKTHPRSNCIARNTTDYDGIKPGEGDFSSDPLISPVSAEFHIMSISPCINRGDNSFVESSWLDIDGEPRINGGAVDVGADEFHYGSTTKKPNAPKELKAKAKSKEAIELKWKDNSNNESGFTIERRDGGQGVWSTVAVADVNAKKHSDGELKSGTTYQYRLRAFNIIGYSGYSNVSQAKTKAIMELRALNDTPAGIGSHEMIDLASAATPSDAPRSLGSLLAVDPIVGDLQYVPATGPNGFLQGSPKSEGCRAANEQQFRRILTRNFLLMKTEVTQGMWAELKDAQPSLPANKSRFRGENRPADGVTWFEAVLFANVLSSERGLKRCYYADSSRKIPIDAGNYKSGKYYCDFRANGFRLPTEGEWEYFTRAGRSGPFCIGEPKYNSTTCHNHGPGLFPGLESAAWFSANADGTTHAVGEKKANSWNLRDVHGNVKEWCWDWEERYPTGTQTDYAGPSSSWLNARICRGGSWNTGASTCRSASRDWGPPAQRSCVYGFRLVRVVGK
ncbi:MAG: SUMF1/EgtB/PvdO family nonheme iron enzyme [Acidobacteriota bacterium]